MHRLHAAVLWCLWDISKGMGGAGPASPSLELPDCSKVQLPICTHRVWLMEDVAHCLRPLNLKHWHRNLSWLAWIIACLASSQWLVLEPMKLSQCNGWFIVVRTETLENLVSVANSEQLICKHTHDSGHLALGLEMQGFAEGTNPKIKMWELIHHKYLLPYTTGASWAIWDSPVHHSRSHSVSLLWNYFKRKPSAPKAPHFYHSFKEREKEFIRSIFKGRSRFFELYNFTFFFFLTENKPMFQSVQCTIQ